MKNKTLHVIAVFSNHMRWKSRTKLFKQFRDHMISFSNVRLHVTELAFGGREFEITDPNDLDHLQLRSDAEIWHKERLINLSVQHLVRRVPDAEYIAWIDADITFKNPNWALETLHALQHHPIVQPWRDAVDLGPDGEVIQTAVSFGYCVQKGLIKKPGKKPYEVYPHSGYAWAARRSTLDQLGGLFDKAILGSGDYLMAWSLVGMADLACPKQCHPNYLKAVLKWQDRAKQLHKDVGYVNGRIEHHFHGWKEDRQYWQREGELVRYQFDPEEHLEEDCFGLWRLKKGLIQFRDYIRGMFRTRNEDVGYKE